MAWLADNWIWVLVGIAFIALHLFGHAGHGGGLHGGGKSARSSPREDGEDRPG